VSTSVRVYVNAQAIDLPRGATVEDALRQWNADEASAVARGERAVTDSRGLPASLADAVAPGSILRVVGARAGQ
jgi:sulfur carrier protein ThiS